MKALGISIGLDFGKLDSDLRAVADRIESVGKAHALKLGAAAGDISTGKLRGDDLAASVSQVGISLSSGLASGIRNASSMMLGFVSRISSMLDHLTGTTQTMFERIDSNMKFPAFDSFFKTAQLRLSNFSSLARKPISDLDIAIAGGMGGTIQQVAKVLKVLIENLATTVSGALKEAVAAVAAEFAKMSEGATRADAAAKFLMEDMGKAAESATKFGKFPPMGNAGLKSSVPGPKIGANVDFTAEAPTPAKPPVQIDWSKAKAMADVAAQGMGVLGATTLKVGAALISVPLRGYVAFSRLGNFLGSLGGVAKRSYSDIYEGHGLIVGSALAAVRAVTSLGTTIFNVATLGIFKRSADDVGQVGNSARISTIGVRAMGAAFRGITAPVRLVKGAVQDLGSMIGSVGGQLLAAFGVVGVLYKVVDFFKQGIKGASDLNEEVESSKVVFGNSFAAVESQVNKLNRAFGVSRKEQYSIASGFGAMAEGAGMSEGAAASFANEMTQLTADFSSAKNLPFAEAGAKIRSALAGEAEPLRQFGVNVLDTTVKAYALSHGMASAGGVISDQAMITARAALVMRGLSYAQGDLERTSGSAANQFRQAGGGLQEFGIRIGQLLLPAIQTGTEAFNTMLGAVLDLFEASLPTIQNWASYFTGAMAKVGMIARNMGSIWKIAQLRIGEFVINSIAWIETIPQNFGPITAWLGRNWWNLLTDLVNLTKTTFTNLGDNAVRFGKALWDALKGNGFNFTWTPLLDGFKATTEQLPELVKPALISVDDAVKEEWAKVAKVEEAHNAAIAKAGAAPKKPEPLDDAKKGKDPDYKLASAVDITSKEAYSIIAKSSSPGARQATLAARGVQIQQQLLDEAKKTNKALGKQPAQQVQVN